MSRFLLSLICVCGVIALVNGHAELSYPVPWVPRPATSAKCPGTDTNAAPIDLYIGDPASIPATAPEDLKLVYQNSMIWKVVAGDGAGPVTLRWATDRTALNFAPTAGIPTAKLYNGPAGTTDGAAATTKNGPYNVTFTIPADTPPANNVVVRINTGSWAACFNANLKAIPPAPKPADKPAPPKTAPAGSATTDVAYNKEQAEECVAVHLPKTAFCFATGATRGGAYVKDPQGSGNRYFPYQIDTIKSPSLVTAAGAFSPEAAIAVDDAIRDMYEYNMESDLVFTSPARETQECQDAYRRYLCADQFPICRGPTDADGACNSACENVIAACKPQPGHIDFLDCPNRSKLGVGKYANQAFDSAGKCPASLAAANANTATTNAVAPVAWLFVVAAALYLL